MKVICNRAALLQAVSVTSTVVPTRSPKPVLSCVKLTAENDRLMVEGTDLEVAITFVDGQVQIDQTGQTLVQADRLRDIVRESSDDTLSLTVEGSEMHVRGADSHFKLLTQSASEFPPIPEHEGTAEIELSAGALKQLIAQTVFATDRQGTRYAFNGVLMVPEASQLVFVATDGRRLALARGELTAPTHKSRLGSKSIIPAKALSLVEKLLTNPEETVRIKVAENQAVFSTTDATLVTNLLEGQFPPYEDVIPKNTDKKMVAGTADFLSAVRRASLLTSDDSKGVRLEFSRSAGLVLTSRNPDAGEAKVDFHCKYDGADLAIGFNPTFLSEALKVINQDEVSLELSNPRSPGLLKAGSSFLYVIMPVNLS